VVAGIVPLIAAGVAGLAVLRPRIGLLAMLLVTPLVDVAQISWTVGSVQVSIRPCSSSRWVWPVALRAGASIRRGGRGALAGRAGAQPVGVTPASDRASRCRSWRFARRWP